MATMWVVLVAAAVGQNSCPLVTNDAYNQKIVNKPIAKTSAKTVNQRLSIQTCWKALR